MSKRDVKKALEMLDKKQLIDLITDLYDLNKLTKEYLEHYVSPNEDGSLEKAKSLIYKIFHPKRGIRLKLTEGKKAISEFKKLKPTNESEIDLLLYYVETGLEILNSYPYPSDSLSNSICSVFEDAMGLIDVHELYDSFKSRTYKIQTDTKKNNLDVGYRISNAFFYVYNNRQKK